MRIFGTMAAALGLVGAIVIGTTAPAAADWYGNHHRYYNYYGWRRRNLERLPARLERPGRHL